MAHPKNRGERNKLDWRYIRKNVKNWNYGVRTEQYILISHKYSKQDCFDCGNPNCGLCRNNEEYRKRQNTYSRKEILKELYYG